MDSRTATPCICETVAIMDATVPMPPDKQELILYRLDQQDKTSEANRTEVKASLSRVFEVVTKTNGRVTALERFRWMISGALIVLVTLIGWYIGLRK